MPSDCLALGDLDRMRYENSITLSFLPTNGKIKFFNRIDARPHALRGQSAIVRHLRDAGHLAQSESFAAADGMLEGELRCRRRVASEPSLIPRKWSLEADQAGTAEAERADALEAAPAYGERARK